MYILTFNIVSNLPLWFLFFKVNVMKMKEIIWSPKKGKQNRDIIKM